MRNKIRVNPWSFCGSLLSLVIFTFPAHAQNPGQSTKFGAICPGFPGEAPGTFIRGDINQSGAVALDDAVSLLTALFVPGSPKPPCDDVADINNDGLVGLFDPIALMNFIFVPGSSPIAAPYPNPGYDEGPDCNGIDDDGDGLIDDGNRACLTSVETLIATPNAYDTVSAIVPILDTIDGVATGYAIAGREDGFLYVRELTLDGELTGAPMPISFSALASVSAITQVFDQNGNHDGYIVAGQNNFDAWAARLAPGASPVWDFSYPANPTGLNAFYNCIQSFDVDGNPDGFTFVGRALVQAPNFDAYVVRTTDGGSVIDSATFGAFPGATARSVAQTRNAQGQVDGYVVSGDAQQTSLNQDAYVARLDLDLNPLWEQLYGIENQNESAGNVVQSFDANGTPDGFVLGGHDNNTNTANFQLRKVTPNGGSVWLNTSNSDDFEFDPAMIETRDATGSSTGYALAGSCSDLNTGETRACVTQYNTSGQTVVSTSLVVGAHSNTLGACQAYDAISGNPNGGYIIAGTTFDDPGTVELIDGLVASVAP